MSIDYDDAYGRARPGQAFSNGFEFDCWEDGWCARCQRDVAFREGTTDQGCPLLLVALADRIPAEWQPGTDDLSNRYTCTAYRPPDWRDPEPQPLPEPPDMDGLFPRPERQVRMLTPAPAAPPAVVTVELVGGLL